MRTTCFVVQLGDEHCIVEKLSSATHKMNTWQTNLNTYEMSIKHENEAKIEKYHSFIVQ